MIALSVNLNKIALLRNSRSGNFPCVLKHAETCLAAGADGITVHPRPDQRHIRPDDVEGLHQLLSGRESIEFNIEGNPFATGFIDLVTKHPPDQCTLVPDSESQLTSDHGFNLKQDSEKLRPVIQQLKALGIRVSLFMDPDTDQISRAAEIDADRIELYTGPFAESYQQAADSTKTIQQFEQHCRAAEHAASCGLGINAGHDLNLDNLQLYRTLPQLLEVSIGHALTVDAIAMGMDTAVRAYKKALAE